MLFSFRKMLISLTKLNALIEIIKDCPIGVPRRNEKIFDIYCNLKTNDGPLVSVKIATDFDTFKECNIDDEDISKRRKIMDILVEQFSNSASLDA